MVQTDDPWRVAKILAFGAFLFNLAAVGLVWWTGTQARQENCAAVVDALDDFTDALAFATGADEVTVEAFRADWHDNLEDCS